MKKKKNSKWPTLEGRLKHAMTSRYIAVKQLKASGIQLSKLAQAILDKGEESS